MSDLVKKVAQIIIESTDPLCTGDAKVVIATILHELWWEQALKQFMHPEDLLHAFAAEHGIALEAQNPPPASRPTTGP